jgi:sterol desaturase/sphingolipid hydroxylase (fatty acid hydroxylase superfamily)
MLKDIPPSLVTTETDSTCSSAHNNTVHDVIENDRVRYVRKGYGLFSAIVVFASFFYFVPIFLKSNWESYLGLTNYRFMIFFTLAILPNIFFWLGQLMMYFIYMSKKPFFERYRLQQRHWPWEKDQAAWRQFISKTLKVVLFNQFVLSPLAASYDSFLQKNIPFRYGLDSFPDHLEIMFHIMCFMIIEDTSFYWLHRALHTKLLYSRIHKKHHEYSTTIAIASLYSHPLEYIFSNMLPTGLAYMVFGNRVHLATILIWFIIRVFETIDGHCGYEFSWSPYRLLPLSGSSEYHNFHHSHNSGSFSSFFTYWDTLCGTNKDYFVHKAKKDREQALNRLRSHFEQKQKSGDGSPEKMKTN